MDNREYKAVHDALEWQLLIGIVAAWAFVALRCLGVVMLLFEGNLFGAVLLACEAALCGWLVTRIHARRWWAASSLIIVWFLGLWRTWGLADPGLPPFLVLAALQGMGLCLALWAIVQLGRGRDGEPRAPAS